jgi:hypothetical protein
LNPQPLRRERRWRSPCHAFKFTTEARLTPDTYPLKYEEPKTLK